jgi:beta-1,4-mannosyl-glycoprotein beta-1,4-N-acetylglucosaminyltransferase
MAVYDCFMFYNELDVLEIRLNILNDYVDFFVITESNRTFTGVPKAYHLANNYERYKAFHHKIIYIQLNDDSRAKELADNPWILENDQRVQLMQGLTKAAPTDTIILSDLDEIPNPEVITSFSETDNYGICMQQHHNYYLNYMQISPKPAKEGIKEIWYSIKGFSKKPDVNNPYWLGSCIFKKSILEKYTLQDLRNVSRAKRIKGKFLINGGWHFSFMGDINYIKQKLHNYAHQEFNTSDINNEENIAKKVADGMSLFDDAKFDLLPLNSPLLPKWVRENHDRFPHLVANKTK